MVLRMMVNMVFLSGLRSKVVGRRSLDGTVVQASRASLSWMAPKRMRKAEMKRMSVIFLCLRFKV
jgi:hypothetical protein